MLIMPSNHYFHGNLPEGFQQTLTESLRDAFSDRVSRLDISKAVSLESMLDLSQSEETLQRQRNQLLIPDQQASLINNWSSNVKRNFPKLDSKLNFFQGTDKLLRNKWRSIQATGTADENEPGLNTDIPLREQHLLICGCSGCQFTKQIEPADVPDEPVVASSQTSGGAIPALSSNPNATAKIYLDFNGHVTSETWWNSNYTDGKNIVTPAYSLDGTNSFSGSETAAIEKIWQRVAEDYAPFNVDITTINPGNFSGKKGLRVVVGGSSKWLGSGAGGVALINSWRWNGDTPVFVFEEQLANGNAKYVAEAISHEVGHALGLLHHSRYDNTGNQTEAYHSGGGKGDTGWAPIMGSAYNKNLTTWRKGSNSNGSSQDDLAIIASSNNGFGYRADDHGNTHDLATVLSGNTTLNAQGIISQISDVDVFSFTTGAGEVSFDVDVAPVGANLDVIAELWDGDSLLVKSNPSEKLDAKLEQFLEAGTYHLHVKSNGQYGRLGQYTLSGTIAAPNNKPANNSQDTGSGSNNKGDRSIVEIGEVGQINNLNHNRQTILLEKDYINPVVFAQPLSRKGKDPSIVRIDNIQSDHFTVQVQEANYKDGYHTTESFSYLVVEAGTWQLADNTFLEVGTFNTNATTTSNWASVNLETDFNNAPVVLSQVQTSNDSDFVRLRQKNVGANGFQVALEQEDALKWAAHGTESVGWMALSAGKGDWNGLAYQAGYTGDRMTDRWSSLSFDTSFSKAPQLLASIASFDGSDPVGLRYQSLSKAGVQMMLEEDASRDKETRHTTEDVGFLALEGSGVLTAQAYDPLNAQKSESWEGRAEAVPQLVRGNGSDSEANYVPSVDLQQDIQLYGSAADYRLETASEGTAFRQGGEDIAGIVANAFNLDSGFGFV